MDNVGEDFVDMIQIKEKVKENGEDLRKMRRLDQYL